MTLVHVILFNDIVILRIKPKDLSIQFNSVTKSCPTLWSHGLQHTRPPCLSPTPRDYSNSGPLSQLCHPTISSSVIPFSSCLQSFPTSGSFQISQLFASGGQSIGVSASTSVLPMNIQDWFPLGTLKFSSTWLYSYMIHAFSCTGCVCVPNCVWLLATPWTLACQVPLSLGFFPARILEWVAISFSGGSFLPRDWTHNLMHFLNWQMDSLPLSHLGR